MNNQFPYQFIGDPNYPTRDIRKTSTVLLGRKQKSQVSVGKYTYELSNIEFGWATGGKLSIGSFCSLAGNISVYLGGGHHTEWVSTYPFGHIHVNTFNSFDGTGHPKTNGDVIIGNDVWIGDNATIMSGVTIGDGAVVGANSHVIKNVTPYSIVVGNPATEYRLRFPEDVIKKLLEIKWWDLPDESINKIAPLLCSKDMDKLLKHFGK